MYKFEVKRYKGVPSLILNGKPTLGWVVGPKLEKRFQKCFPEHIYMMTISSILDIDYFALDRDIEKLLQKDKDAYILFNVKIDQMPSWWLKEYPEELILYDDGSKETFPSLASEIWKKDAGEAVKNLTHHLKEKYDKHFLGYYFGWGIYGEWNYYGEPDKNDWRCPDFSPAMVKGFRKWLRKKYQNDVTLLRKSWGNKKVNFNNAKVPGRIERFYSDLGVFKNPSGNKQVSDYYLYIGELAADILIYFCKIVKEETKNTVICGGGYGGLMDAGLTAYLYISFTTALGLKKVLDSPYVDFLSTPYSYFSREVGIGDCSYMGVTESWKLHNKLRMGDNDTRTCLAPPEQKVFGRPDSIKDSVEILKRDFGQHLVRASCGWWAWGNTDWFDHPSLIKTLSKLHKIGNLSLNYERRFTGGIAMIVDTESLLFLRMANNLVYRMLYRQRMDEFGRVGTPWDVYLHNDLSNPEMPDYKVYLFLNIFYLTKKEREEIKKKVCKNNNTVIWMYAPGFLNEKGGSKEEMFKLTGIKINYENIAANSEIKITNFSHPITKDILPGSKDSFFGVKRMFEWGSSSSHGHMDHGGIVEPIFYADDSDAIVLGKVISINKPGFVIKKMKDWTSIYISSPMVSAKILRNICKFANVHIYLETEDILYANKHFIVIHTKEKGKKKIKLLKKADVYEIYENRVIGKGIKEFTEELPAKVTRIYFLKQ